VSAETQQVVRFHYSVAEVGQPPMESSRETGQPIAALIGAGNIIAGLEQALIGKQVGERFDVVVAAAEAYGARNEALTQRVPKKYFPTQVALRPGVTVMLQTQQGPRPVTVLKVGMSVVDVDLNHPMAGKDLSFDIEIVEVRAATEEELAHGHVHGDGGVHAH
jgi:FKBP-type peptidyl-prolyl cis-trans isomerase SlyD